jgi:hypothetical protein
MINLALLMFVSSPWVPIPGGTWVPSQEVVAEFQGKIEAFVQKRAALDHRELQDWSTYTFQYQGQQKGHKQFVYINAFCDARDDRVEKEFVETFNGGSCYFSLRYYPRSKSFKELYINGDF